MCDAEDAEEFSIEAGAYLRIMAQDTGLGLSQVMGFARQEGCTVVIRSRVGEGTLLELLLQSLPEAVSCPLPGTGDIANTSMPPIRRASQGKVVLVVDNDLGTSEARFLAPRGRPAETHTGSSRFVE